MALTNIFNEPRREITETLIGMSIVALPIYADYKWATWLAPQMPPPYSVGFFVALLIGAVLALVGYAILHFTHEIGDSFCDVLEQKGLQVRPKERNR